MSPHVCPWWGGYFIDNRFRRLLHRPEQILAGYLTPGMTAMDFGCGMGFFSIPMARRVGERGTVIAMDLQPQMLRTLNKRAEKAGMAGVIRTHVCQRDSIAIRESVNFVLAFWSAHEAPDFAKLIAELAGCLVPGGRLLLVEPVGHVTAEDFQQMLAAAQQTGLQIESRPAIRLSRAAVLVSSS